MSRIEEIIRNLPADLRREVEDFADFLAQRDASQPVATFDLNWRGGLEEFRDQFSSVELQHAALGWWTEECT